MMYLCNLTSRYPRYRDNLSIFLGQRQLMATVHPSWKVSTGGSMLAFETSGRAGADRDTSTCSCDQLCRILGGLNKAPPRVHSTLPSHPILFIPRARYFPLIVATLFSTCDAKYRTGAERESNREEKREDRIAVREGDGTSRQGESYWFFRTSDRRDEGDERWGGDCRRRIARRNWKGEKEGVFAFSSISVLFDGLQWSLQSVLYLCCHGNSLDSGEKFEKTRSRWIARREEDEKRTQRGNSGEELMLRVSLFQISVPSAVSARINTSRSINM